MQYELRLQQPIGKNLCRIFRGQIKRALKVARGGAEPPDTRVHALRKHLKKARAALRLARGDTGGFRQQDRRLRDVGRLTTQIRDAEVRLQTFREFKEETAGRSRAFARIERLLAAELEKFSVAFAGWETQAIPLLESAHTAVAQWEIEHYEPAQFRRAVERTYKCGRKALTLVHAEPTAANVHQLRKRVKWLGYEVRIIRPLHPAVLDVVTEKLAHLGELLGRVHDLSFLATRLCLERSARLLRPQDDELLMMIEHRRATLQYAGIAIAECVFAEGAPSFISRLGCEVPPANSIAVQRSRSRRVQARTARIPE